MALPDFLEDAAHLPPRWQSLAVTLAEYARHLSGSEPIWQKEQWVFRPNNFVTFRIQHKRKTGMTLYLRGYSSEFATLTALGNAKKTVVGAIPGYSKMIIDDFGQVPEAILAVDRAYQLSQRGSRRRRRGMVVAENS